MLQKDGVVFVVSQQKAFLEVPCFSHYFKLSPNITAIVTGSLPDGRAAIEDLSESIEKISAIKGKLPEIQVYVETLGAIFERYTHYSQARPFGCHIFLTDGKQIFQISPQGEITCVYAAATGMRWQSARVELEKLMDEKAAEVDRYGHLRRSKNQGGKLVQMPVATGLQHALDILRVVTEETTDMMLEVLILNENGEK